MSTLTRVITYIKPYRWRLLGMFGCMLGIAALGFITIGSLQPVMALLFPPVSGNISLFPPSIENLHIPVILQIESYATNHRWQVFYICCVILVCAGFLRFLFAYGQEFLIQNIGERVMLDIRKELYAHIHTLSLRYFTQKDTGTQMAHLTTDIEIIGSRFMLGCGDIAKEPLIMISLLALMFIQNWKLAIISLVFFPLISYPLIRFGKSVRNQSRILQEERAHLNKLLHETITGIRIVKAFGMEYYENERFLKKVKTLFSTSIRIIRISALSSPLTEFFGVIGIVGTLVIASYFVYRKELTVDQFGTFIVALVSFYQPIKRVSSANNNAQIGLAGAERVFKTLDTPTDIKESLKPISLNRPQKDIQFHHVYFEYDYKVPVLQDINLVLPLNKVIAIVGPSGAGKTTLVNLLPRFYDTTSGSIMIDGMDIKEVSLKSLRDQMGIVTQDTILFDDTIFNNIAYGRPDFDIEKVYDAARIAHADEFIRQLPKGYETEIGERGVKLSGGQKQRLTIARAILKNPSILIFDEATSSLDAESERLVQDALEKLMQNRTTVIIAHRLSTILRADIILVLDRGRLVEQGTHRVLIDNNGVYTKLYQTQFAAGSG